MLWAVLLQSEYRRVKKAVLDLARTNPIILVAIVAVAAGLVALAVRSADLFAVFSIVPGGLSGFSIILLLIGSVMGYTFSLTLPKAEYFDEQFRLTTVRPIEMLIGLRGLPLLLVVAVATVPTAAMMWRVYALVTVPAHGAWAAVFGMLYLTAALQGAATYEALRGYRSWRLFAIATLAMAGTLAASFLLSFGVQNPWYWLATYLPAASIDADGFAVTLQPIHITTAGAATSVVLSIIAWTAYSLRPDNPLHRRRAAFSVPIGTSTFTAFPAWATLTMLRQSESRNLVVLTVLIGIGAVPLLSHWSGSGTISIVVLLMSTLILFLTAVAVLTCSEDRFAGSWLIRTTPASRVLIGLAWWITVSLLTVAIGGLALVPSIVGFPEGSGTIMLSTLLLIVYASSTTIVGRLLPWSRQSPFRQLVASVALMAGVSVTYYVASQLAARLGATIGSEGLIVAIVGLLLLVVTGALSVAIEWVDS